MTKVQRDITIIQLLSEGKSAKEIGEQVDLSGRTIEYRIDVLKAAHGAENNVNLVKIAIRKKLIKV